MSLPTSFAVATTSPVHPRIVTSSLNGSDMDVDIPFCPERSASSSPEQAGTHRPSELLWHKTIVEDFKHMDSNTHGQKRTSAENDVSFHTKCREDDSQMSPIMTKSKATDCLVRNEQMDMCCRKRKRKSQHPSRVAESDNDLTSEESRQHDEDIQDKYEIDETELSEDEYISEHPHFDHFTDKRTRSFDGLTKSISYIRQVSSNRGEKEQASDSSVPASSEETKQNHSRGDKYHEKKGDVDRSHSCNVKKSRHHSCFELSQVEKSLCLPNFKDVSTLQAQPFSKSDSTPQNKQNTGSNGGGRREDKFARRTSSTTLKTTLKLPSSPPFPNVTDTAVFSPTESDEKLNLPLFPHPGLSGISKSPPAISHRYLDLELSNCGSTSMLHSTNHSAAGHLYQPIDYTSLPGGEIRNGVWIPTRSRFCHICKKEFKNVYR